MRILMVSKALVTGVYQRKLEELARFPDVELLAIVPPYWQESRVGQQPLNELHTSGYELSIEKMRFNGHHHVHYYPGIGKRIRAFQPDIVHIDEEPYNFVAAHTAWHARRNNAKSLFFAWQNIFRRYPPPFNLFERYSYRTASVAIAGNKEAARVLRRKGFRKQIAIIPQFGIDPEIYRPLPKQRARSSGPVIGFISRIVPEKGLETLIESIVQIPSRPEVRIIGAGSYRLELELKAERLGVRDRIRFPGSVPPEKVPHALAELDLLVLPSETQPNWKEQFGRILVEAMACEVPVIGSDSGEIPNVIGEAGLIFPEGDAAALAKAIRSVIDDPEFAKSLGKAGRERVLQNYTQERVADHTYQIYNYMLDSE